MATGSQGRGDVSYGISVDYQGNSRQKSRSDDSRNRSQPHRYSRVASQTTHYAYRAHAIAICGIGFLTGTGTAIWQLFGK